MSALLPVYERDLVIVSGKGSRLTDVAGKTYLDFAAGIGVSGLGHGDRQVLRAIRAQAGRLIHASNLYHTPVVSELAQRLTAVAFPSKVFFSNSGTEAVEAAIKFARRIGRPVGRTDLVAFERAFHGRTLGALSLTWSAKYREPFEPLVPGVKFLPWDDLQAAAAGIDSRTAAVFVEPVQGEGGVRPAPPAFLQGLRDICRDAGALLVSEEVQCGLGRTGRLFAYEHAGIKPDMVTLAKPLGGGLPLGAVLLREDLAPLISAGDHGSTFGGNPVAAAASLAVLDRLTEPGFLDKVEKKAGRLRRGLNQLARKHGAITQVRSIGLMVGIELSGSAAQVVRALRERGVLATRAGDHVLRLLPPLVVRPKEIREFLDVLEAVLASGAGRPEEPVVTRTGAGGAVA
ncbi:MAG TPA: acetylornithine/succinylornithine family transaminase [Vicinamibacteria bacterium]|nr:acetylornithine/succinylornithine family transaminase [Vicinamibacteria bacterium]